MIRTTKDWKKIEINTYEDLKHMQNIIKLLKIHWFSTTVAWCRHTINAYLKHREDLEDEVLISSYSIY